MSKVVINCCYGGFGLSEEAKELYSKKKGLKEKLRYDWGLERDDPDLVAVVEELGEAANSDYSELSIVELEPGELYIIDEYDGKERVVTSNEINFRRA